jgi:dienelactone hydrolase
MTPFNQSFVTREDVKGVTAPVYAGLAENDEMIPASFARDLQAWMMQEAAAPFTMEIYPGMKHGFGARPDSADEDVRRQYERAFQRTIGFLNGST